MILSIILNIFILPSVPTFHKTYFKMFLLKDYASELENCSFK